MIIFDCNGVLVDSEPIAAAVAAHEFRSIGLRISPQAVARCFTGQRPRDMVAEVEKVTGVALPRDFAPRISAAIMQRLEQELRATEYVAQALKRLPGPRCVASASPPERLRLSLQRTDLLRFFEPNVFSASHVVAGKPAPDLFLHVARKVGIVPQDCIVVEDTAAGIRAAMAAQMMPIGYIGGSHAPLNLCEELKAAGALAVIADMRELKSAVVPLRGY